MAVYQQIGRTGSVRAEFMGDDMQNTRRNEYRIYIKGFVVGAAWLRPREKMVELKLNSTERKAVYPFKRALKKRGKKIKLDSGICQFHGLKLNPDGSCPFKLESAGRQLVTLT